MSSAAYNSPLFGQGDPTDNFELIPLILPTDLDHQIAIPLDTFDATLPSAYRWWWRAVTWQATLGYSLNSGAFVGSWVLNLTSTLNPINGDERDLVDPSAVNGARWTVHQRISAAVPSPASAATVDFVIGSFYEYRGGGPPTLDELFYEIGDGTFAPRILVQAITVIPDVTLTIVNDNTLDQFASITIDGVSMPTVSASCDLPIDYATLTFTPTLFWSWDGRFNTTTGARL